MCLAYRTNKAIAIHISQGLWEVIPLDGYDPNQITWREFKQTQKTQFATNRQTAIRIAKDTP